MEILTDLEPLVKRRQEILSLRSRLRRRLAELEEEETWLKSLTDNAVAQNVEKEECHVETTVSGDGNDHRSADQMSALLTQ
jgi:hypothetical protein